MFLKHRWNAAFTLLFTFALFAGVPREGIAQGQRSDLLLNAQFNEPGWLYNVNMYVPNRAGARPTFRMLLGAEVPPGETPDSISWHWMFSRPAERQSEVSIRTSTETTDVVPRWREDDGEAVAFSVPLQLVERLSRSDAVVLQYGDKQYRFTSSDLRRFRRFFAATTQPPALAKLAHGEDATPDDLREPVDLRQALTELTAYSIRYDRFEERYDLRVSRFPLDVLQGADSAFVHLILSVEQGEPRDLVFLAFDVFGAPDPLEARARIWAPEPADTVLSLDQGRTLEIEGGQRVAFTVESMRFIMAFLAAPPEVKLYPQTEVSFPVLTRRVFGKAFDISRSVERITNLAYNVYECDNLAELDRRDAWCQMTEEAMDQILTELRSGQDS